MIGDFFATERKTFVDEATGRMITQLTGAAANSYPLYYFTTSLTRDSRHLVFHSERGGWVQLYRLDLGTGEIARLTDGRTQDSGWAIWCEWHVRGIYNHLAALDPLRDEVYYFQDEEIRATHVGTLANRLVATLPRGRMPIGQSGFSPDGSTFAFIHVDRESYVARLKEREALTAMGQFNWTRDHPSRFRNGVATTLAVLDTATGAMRTVTTTDYHFHHVLFIDNATLLINHPQNCTGMWSIALDGNNAKHLRPHTLPRTNSTAVNHQVITTNGIAYEASTGDGKGGSLTHLGMFHPDTETFEEAPLPLEGYVHVGADPAGRFDFVEHAASDRHEILTVHPAAADAEQLTVRTLRTLRSPAHDDQRNHAHPFLSLDRSTLFFTDWDINGFSQVHSMDVRDLVS
jgi:hypothetical protein